MACHIEPWNLFRSWLELFSCVAEHHLTCAITTALLQANVSCSLKIFMTPFLLFIIHLEYNFSEENFQCSLKRFWFTDKAQNCSLLHMSCHFVGGMCTWVGVEIDSRNMACWSWRQCSNSRLNLNPTIFYICHPCSEVHSNIQITGCVPSIVTLRSSIDF
jgi:hypothetical protein